MGETLPMVVPVRYAGGGLTMQTTTSRIGEDGVFIRGFVTPREGAPVALQLTLPGADRPVGARGTVRERVMPGTPGKDAGFWVQFESLDPPGREIISVLLRERGAPGAPAKRAFERVRTRLEVGWASPREFLVAYSENISRGGIFVATPNPPALGEVVDLFLDLPDGSGPAKTLAQVIQRISPEQGQHLNRAPGAGLQFVGADDEFRRRLDTCIEHLLTLP